MRFTLLLAAGAAALATAGTALAAYSPQIVVTSPAAAGAAPLVTTSVKVNQTDDPTAKVTIYVPQGYQVGAPAVGTKLGTVTAHAEAADLGGVVLPLAGDVLAIDPKSGVVPQQQAVCVPGVTPASVWDLHLTAAGQVLDVPIFVVQTVGAESAIAQYKLVICLPPPDVPAGTPGRATFGAKLMDAIFTNSAITNPSAAGEYRWRTLWTPYTPKTGQPNAAGTQEAQAIVRVPTQATLTVKKSKVLKGKGKARRTWTLVTITGKVTENGTGLAAQSVSVGFAKTATGKLTRLPAVKTAADGSYKKTLLVKNAIYVQADTTIALRNLGAAGCTQTFAPVPCTSASVGDSHPVSRKVKVTAYKFK